MFLAGMVFAAIACFARSDFNMALFGFLYVMWDQDDVSICNNNMTILIE